MNAPHDRSHGFGRNGRILAGQSIGHLIDDRLFAQLDHRDRFACVYTEVNCSLVVKMNRDNVRSTARSVANQEFHRSGEVLNEAAPTASCAGCRMPAIGR